MSHRVNAKRTALGAAVGMCLFATTSDAQRLAEPFWVTNGTVNATAETLGHIFIGGSFDKIGAATGAAVNLDLVSGAAITPYPMVVGTVLAVASDGAGGWFLAGRFRFVGGEPRANLAHIGPDERVTSWAPECDDQVEALMITGGRLYVAGRFRNINS